MMDYNRQELQDDIFKMYKACLISDDKKSRNAPIDIDRIKKLLTGNRSPYQEMDVEAEFNYLVNSKYFDIYATHFVIPTVHGMNKIWGGTTNFPVDFNNNLGVKMEKTEEVLKLFPELYGVGINLKILWKKIKNWFKYGS